MAIEINKGIEPFEDQTDFTRGNPDRKPWGKSGLDGLDLRSEYDTPPPTSPTTTQQPNPPAPDPPPAPKFTHKMANGTVLEATTMEDLATQIEKAISTQAPPAAPLEFEDKPVYEGYQFQRKELSLQDQANILNVMKENPQKAYRMLQEAETGATTEKLLQVLNETQMALRMQKEIEAGVDFMGECEDFNPSKANGEKLTSYIRSKGKPITVQNLKVAFRQLVDAGDKALLMKVEAPPVEEDKTLIETPPPPTVIPSNLGRPEAPAPQTVDVAKFASMSLNDQKKFFADQKRRA